jgi:restriction system protein
MSNRRAWLVQTPIEIAADVEKKSAVAVGGNEHGDLNDYKNLMDLRKHYKQLDPSMNDKRIIVWAGNLWMFSKEMKKDDYVLAPIKIRRVVLFGRISDEYVYDPAYISNDYPHIRHVNWLRSVSRDSLSPSFKNTIGAFRAVCNIDGLLPEIDSILSDKPPIKPQEPPEGVIPYHEEVQEKASEIIADVLSRMDPYDFQDLVASLIKAMGFNTDVSPAGPDGGIDITAYPDVFGFESPRIKIQVKLRKGNASAQEIQQLVGAASNNEALFVSIGGFTQQAINESKKHAKLVLIDRDRFVTLLLQFYEKMDSESKALIPLKKIYIPTTE